MSPEQHEANEVVENKLIDLAKVMLDRNYGTVVIGIQHTDGSCETFSNWNIIVARGLCDTLLEDNLLRMEKWREESQ